MAREPVVIPESYAAPTIDVRQREVTHVGSRYEGSVSISTGRREGHGRYIYPNTYFVYEGEWLNGKKHGRGRLSFGEDDGFYEGEFNEGEITGQGSQTWRDGTVYTGQFVSGERHGQGSITRSDGSSYNGSWAFNKHSGQGQLDLPNGDCYIGEFKSHKYHGTGVLTQPSSDRRYEGAFEAGLFQGDGELKLRGDAFIYKGQFIANRMAGEGKGTDTASGISYAGTWKDDEPIGRGVAWDLSVAGESERVGESYIPASETLREEAAEQLNPGASDPKAKVKAKGKAAAAPAEEEDPGAMLVLTAGEPFPGTQLRLLDSENQHFPGESGRRWKITMFRERKVPKQDDPSEFETLRREVRFGDQRTEYVDPIDAAQAAAEAEAAAAKKGGKAAAAPDPTAADAAEDEEGAPEPYAGEASMDGSLGESGDLIIGKHESWLLPLHLQPLIYWLRVEDTTEKITSDSFFQQLPPLEFPVRVRVPE